MIIVQNGKESRHFSEADLPLAFDISIDGTVSFGSDCAEGAVAWLEYGVGELLIRKAEAATQLVRFNGIEVATDESLSDGGELAIGDSVFKVAFEDDLVFMTLVEEEMPSEAEIVALEEQASLSLGNPESNEAKDSRRSEENPSDPTSTRSRGKRWLKMPKYLYGVLFAIIACGALPLISVPVAFLVDPVPDELVFGGFPRSIEFGERHWAFPGEYTLIVEKAGYHPIERIVTVEHGGEEVVDIELQKLPGLLSLRSASLEGAEVVIDGEARGVTPLIDIELEPGTYDVELRAPRYQSARQSIEIEGMGIAQAVDLPLRPGWGALEVDSDPSGSDVILDGAHVGKTPLALEPMGGDYLLEVRREGWEPQFKKVTIEPEATLSLPVFVLQAMGSYVSISSSPADAVVTQNGVFKGITPLTLGVAPGEENELVISKDGFVSQTHAIRLAVDKRHDLEVELDPKECIVFLNVEPADAELKIDGLSVGIATRRVRLSAAPHRLEISRDGYVAVEELIDLEHGVSKTLTIELKTEAQVRFDAIPAETETSEGQVLRRVLIREPTSFEMGSHRREPGHRSNEAQRKVVLTRSFYASEKEVTIGAYRRFVSGGDEEIDLEEDSDPATGIGWDAAARYLNWLSLRDGFEPAYYESDGKMHSVLPVTTGYRLPTEAEWTYLSRYEGGARTIPLKYPWGEGRIPGSNVGNFGDSSAAERLSRTLPDYTDGFPGLAPVGSFAPNAAGFYDLGGNVSEWCHDYYDTRFPFEGEVKTDPVGPEKAEYHLIRGSSWRHGGLPEMRLSFRDFGRGPRDDVGFRIFRYAEEPIVE